MTRLRAMLASCLIAIGFLAIGDVTPCQADPPLFSKWIMTFQDEFSGSQLDRNKWNTSFKDNRRAPRPGSGQLQYYADENVQVQHGLLRLRAEKRPIESNDYASGLITSYGKFDQLYGYFEIRAKVPKGQGFWPAFWLYSINPNFPDEIDVMEILGRATNTVHMTHHFWKVDHLAQHGGSFTGPDFSQDFHTYGVYWSPLQLIWYVDGVERYRDTEWLPRRNLFILINLAIGGQWSANPDATTPFPADYLVDYIHVYRELTFPPVPPPHP